MNRYLLLLLIILMLGCDPIDDRLFVINKSNDTIFYSLSTNDSVTINPIRILESKDTIYNESCIVLPDSFSKHGLIGTNEWEYFINQDCKDSNLRVFIFEKKMLVGIPWDTIVEKQEYSKKYKFNVEELKKLNWRIEYP